MAKPYRHAQSSARKFGGEPEDYLDIHQLMDSSKGTIADNRHRALTHNAWFISTIIERVFGVSRKNSAGRLYMTRDIAEQHVLEDFAQRFIPSAQDYLQGIPFEDWMQNGLRGHPPSAQELIKHGKKGTKRTSPKDQSIRTDAQGSDEDTEDGTHDAIEGRDLGHVSQA